jgi:hypothetical protein
VSVELRKARKDDQLLKRRNLNTEDDATIAQQEKSQSPVPMTIAEMITGMAHKILFINCKMWRAHEVSKHSVVFPLS